MLLLLIFGGAQVYAQNKTEGNYEVYFFLLDECKICQYYGPQLEAFHEQYPQFVFKGYFPNFSSKKNNIQKFKETFGITFDLKTDYFKSKSKAFDLEILPSVVVYDPVENQVLYKGRIDDAFTAVGRRKKVIRSKDLLTILEAIANQTPIPYSFKQPVGCFINFADKISN